MYTAWHGTCRSSINISRNQLIKELDLTITVPSSGEMLYQGLVPLWWDLDTMILDSSRYLLIPSKWLLQQEKIPYQNLEPYCECNGDLGSES
jgi:hypothetical protein